MASAHQAPTEGLDATTVIDVQQAPHPHTQEHCRCTVTCTHSAARCTCLMSAAYCLCGSAAAFTCSWTIAYCGCWPSEAMKPEAKSTRLWKADGRGKDCRVWFQARQRRSQPHILIRAIPHQYINACSCCWEGAERQMGQNFAVQNWCDGGRGVRERPPRGRICCGCGHEAGAGHRQSLWGHR